MARARRLQTPDLIRHVMARGNGRMAIFLDDGDHREFVYLLGEAVEQFTLHCWNYCMMPNHYHITLQPTRANLSEAIRQLNSRYGQWWNKRHEKVGHVFQGRFKDQIVDKDGYLLALSRYVVMNPVRARLVQRPEDWLWSSYRATIGACEVPSFLATSKTLNLFGVGTELELQERYTRFVTACTEDPAIVDRFRSNQHIIGTQAFKQQIQSQPAQLEL
jgi:REP element-mobilizing transposase RayT